MRYVLDMRDAIIPAHQTIDAFDIVAIARVPALYANATDHAIGILATCRDACYSAERTDPEWLAGYRQLTRAMALLQLRHWPAAGVNVLTVDRSVAHERE